MYEIANTAVISQKGSVYPLGLSDKGEQCLSNRRDLMNSKTWCNLLLDKGIFRELCVGGKRLHFETGKVGKIVRSEWCIKEFRTYYRHYTLYFKKYTLKYTLKSFKVLV